MNCAELFAALNDGTLDPRLEELYGREVDSNRTRLANLVSAFKDAFPGLQAGLFSSPGRTEMGGNHTDHQLGRVLAGSVDLDMVACAGLNGTNEITVKSVGYPDVVVALDDLGVRDDERETSAALVRGIARALQDRGFEVQGVSIVMESKVLGGSGLSSSASYEILIGVILNHYFCDDSLSAVELAQIGQFAENQYFGKPSGLMDQLACSVGGAVYIDFATPGEPIIEQVDVDLAGYGYALCIIDSGADHADLTDEYAGIIGELRGVSQFFGADYLSQVDEREFWARLGEVRAATSDRAILRAIHFFDDTARVPEQKQTLAEGRFDDFLALVTASGISSSTHLQNIFPAGNPSVQPVNVTLALAEHLLGGRGAVRVHGGGFAGTVQAYVPVEMLESFRTGIDAILGAGSCHVLTIRPVGGAVIAAG